MQLGVSETVAVDARSARRVLPSLWAKALTARRFNQDEDVSLNAESYSFQSRSDESLNTSRYPHTMKLSRAWRAPTQVAVAILGFSVSEEGSSGVSRLFGNSHRTGAVVNIRYSGYSPVSGVSLEYVTYRSSIQQSLTVSWL